MTTPGVRVVGRGAVPGAVCGWKDFSSSLSCARAHGENRKAGAARQSPRVCLLHVALTESAGSLGRFGSGF